MANTWKINPSQYKIQTTPEVPGANVLYFDLLNNGIYSGPKKVSGSGGGGGSPSTTDYDDLQNKPQINSVVLQGNLSWDDLGLHIDHIVNIYVKTTAEWNATPTLRSEPNTIYIYSDHQWIDDKDVPGIKIGDGNAYVADLPFTDAVYAAHIADSDIHVTAQEKTTWTNAVNSLKSMAFADTASGSVTSSGTFSGATISGSVTPSGNISVGTGTANYTPNGSIDAPIISLSSGGTTDTIHNPTKATVLMSATVVGETLIFTAGDSISTSDVTVKTGDGTYSASAPAWHGTAVELKFTGTSSSISGSASGSISTTGSVTVTPDPATP